MRQDAYFCGPIYKIKQSITSSGNSYTIFDMKTWRKAGATEKSFVWQIVAYGGLGDMIAKNAEDGTVMLVSGDINTYKEHGDEKIQVIAKNVSFMGRGRVVTEEQLFSEQSGN